MKTITVITASFQNLALEHSEATIDSTTTTEPFFYCKTKQEHDNMRKTKTVNTGQIAKFNHGIREQGYDNNRT